MRLQGKTVGYFLAQEVEDLEFWVPLMRLQEEGARTIVIGLSNEKVRGHHGLEMTPDVSIEEAPKASTVRPSRIHDRIGGKNEGEESMPKRATQVVLSEK